MLTSEHLERLSVESPLEHFRLCRTLLQHVSHPEFQRYFQKISRYPFARNYQPSAAALALASFHLGLSYPPLAPLLLPSGAPLGVTGGGWLADRLLPVPIASQLANLWQQLGSLTRDDELLSKAALATKWVQKMGTGSRLLFTRESMFDPSEQTEGEEGVEFQTAADPSLGLAGFSTPPLSAFFTLSGWNTGLGTLRLGAVEICSFGPQSEPIGDMGRFGLSQHLATSAVCETSKKEIGLCGWSRCYGSKDIWLHLNATASNRGAEFDVRFMGIEPNEPISMVFYIKAADCSLEDGTVIYPRSLQRFRGAGRKIIFDKSVQLSCREAMNIQVIPLAGVGCFWNATFLISFEFNSSLSRASYSIAFV